MLIACLTLLIYHFFKKKKQNLSTNSILKLLGIGGIVALHWFFFYHSIKNSTISVALVCLSSSALFTSFLSPFFTKNKTSLVDLITGLVIILGIFLIFHFETSYTEGIIYGLIAALMASLFTILNEIEVKGIEASVISYYEMLGGFILMSIYIGITFNHHDYHFLLNFSDLAYLILLGTVCTAFAYVMGVLVMKELSAYTVVLTTNLEPVYGILLAFLIFGQNELMSAGFYQGAFIILTAVFCYPFIKKRFNLVK